MDMFKEKWKKAIEKYKSMTMNEKKKKKKRRVKLSKSQSWPSTKTPQGCFPVYVGTERRRFVVSAEQSAHPLFRMLLEDAETEYGHNSQGPLLLPCDVDLFSKVLAEMVHSHDDENSYPWRLSAITSCFHGL